ISAWYHIVVRVDTTQTDEITRYRIYINGEEDTDLNVNSAHSTAGTINSDVRHFIGARGHASGPTIDNYGNISIAGVSFVDGRSLGPEAFAHESPDTGAWVMEDIPTNEAAATGGDLVTHEGEYRVHKFTSNGTISFSEGGKVEYLVVGGGGGGGGNGDLAGGGGAGGYRTGFLEVPKGDYGITIGDGGAMDNPGGYSAIGEITTATGGTITTDGDHTVHKFTANGTLTVADGGLVEYL
ncbi:uncharacterized protein METZ01_LOCUS489294, partial [marine metagenome]